MVSRILSVWGDSLEAGFNNLQLVVDRQSSVLGLASSRGQQVPIHTDHSEICKFAKGDYRFWGVSEKIKKFIHENTASGRPQLQNYVAYTFLDIQMENRIIFVALRQLLPPRYLRLMRS